MVKRRLVNRYSSDPWISYQVHLANYRRWEIARRLRKQFRLQSARRQQRAWRERHRRRALRKAAAAVQSHRWR